MHESRFYNRIADQYDEMAFGNDSPNDIQIFLAHEYKLICELLSNKENIRLIDFGCGTGYYLSKLKPYINHGIGIDISAEMANIAKKRFQRDKNIAIACHDVCHMPQDIKESKSNMGICTFNTLGTVQNHELFLEKMLEQITRGRILASLFNGAKFATYARKIYNSWTNFVGPITSNNFDDEEKIFSNSSTGYKSRWLIGDKIIPKRKNVRIKIKNFGIGSFIILKIGN